MASTPGTGPKLEAVPAGHDRKRVKWCIAWGEASRSAITGPPNPARLSFMTYSPMFKNPKRILIWRFLNEKCTREQIPLDEQCFSQNALPFARLVDVGPQTLPLGCCH